MIASGHDDLDAGRLTLGNGVGDGGTGRIHHSHDSDHPEAGERKVDLVRVEGESGREFSDGKSRITKGDETFTERSEFGAGVAEGLLEVLIDGTLLEF